MKRLNFVFVLCLLFLSSTITRAQDDDIPAGWEIEDRCIGEHSPPPNHWAFDGAILMTGYYGVHAYQQDWETPRVIAFIKDSPIIFRWGTPGLSPNGRWFVATIGTASYYPGSSWSSTLTEISIEEIIVYSTVNSDEIYRMPWHASHYLERHYTIIDQMYWIDNEHLLYESWDQDSEQEINVIINPFEGTTQRWEGLPIRYTRGADGDSLVISPDFTLAVSLGAEANYGWYAPLSPYPQGLYDITTSEMTAEIDLGPAAYDAVIWMPDSSHFVALVADEPYTENTLKQLVLFDRDGNIVDVLISSLTHLSFYRNRDWSPDGRYLSFRAESGGDLYIADMQERRIINTCLTEIGSGAAWSPDSTQLALLAPGDGIQYILVLDIETYSLHPVAHHNKGYGGSIIGWRESG